MKKAIALLLLLVACGGEKKEVPAAPETQKTVKATQGVKTETVSVTTFQKTIDTTGTVAFNQNRSTQVLSPISGPVSRINVNVGSRVSRGEALALVSSPDFAAAVSALRKAEGPANGEFAGPSCFHQMRI